MNTETQTQTKTAHERLIDFVLNTPDAPCRRWSYEIEAVNLGNASDTLQNLGFDTHCDPSITSDSCECSCEACVHECDCSNCSIANGWDDPEHCGDCSDTEAAPSDHKPVTTTHDAERLAPAIAALERAGSYVDDTCGGHIHIDASDLSARQVATVMRIWNKAQELLPTVVGRTENHYAELSTAEEIEAVADSDNTERYYAPERYRAVNALNWFNARHSSRENPTKFTLEFRQFSGELDAPLIIARGFLCRAIVEHAKSNRANLWLLGATDAVQFLRELRLAV